MIVGIGCTYQVGKDTAAAALVRDLGFQRIGFADRVKELALHINPIVVSAQAQKVNVEAGRGRLQWVHDGLGGWEAAKVQYPEVRIFLQKLGEGVRNYLGDETWIDAVLNRARHSDTVIPDVRYTNEAEAIKDEGGLLVKITRPGYGPANGHASENDLAAYEGWDLVINNSGSIETMQAQLVTFVTSETARRLASNERAA